MLTLRVKVSDLPVLSEGFGSDQPSVRTGHSPTGSQAEKRSETSVPRRTGLGITCCPLSGMGPVHMNEVRCSGFEKSITECQFNKDALGCSHEEDAAVRCNVPAMGFQEMVITHALNHTIGPKTFRISARKRVGRKLNASSL